MRFTQPLQLPTNHRKLPHTAPPGTAAYNIGPARNQGAKTGILLIRYTIPYQNIRSAHRNAWWGFPVISVINAVLSDMLVNPGHNEGTDQ